MNTPYEPSSAAPAARLFDDRPDDRRHPGESVAPSGALARYMGILQDGRFLHTERGEWWVAAIIAAFITLLFYAQSLVSGSLNAGFVYTGDFFHVWLPQAAKVSELAQRGALTGIDYSTHGGGSEFFLRPNLYPYHPLGIVYGWLSRTDAPQRLIRFGVVLLALHSFLGCWFAIRLGVRYLRFSWPVSVFLAVGYCFSVPMVHAAGFPPFLLCASLVPWAIYAGLAVAERPTVTRAILYSVPMFVMFTGGYVPIAITAVAIAWLVIAAKLLLLDEDPLWFYRFRRLLVASAPFAIATIVAAPLYYAMAVYHNLVHAVGAVSIFFSAHQLGEQPRTLLRLLSSRMYYAGPTFEFTLVWGLVPIALILLFVAGLRATDQLSRQDSRLLTTAAIVYGFLMLAIYGDYSAASDLLFFVPFIGRMHIYQRHLLVGHLFFVLALAVMLKTVIARGRQPYLKTMLFVMLGLLATFTHLLAIDSQWAKDLHLSDFIIIELLFASMFVAFAFLSPGPLLGAVGAFLMLLVPLDQFYNFSTSTGNRYEAQRTEQLALDEPNRQRVTDYFRRYGGGKEIIKYVDVTPGIANYFSRNHPWFVALDIPLSSYGGYDFLLALRESYFQKMLFAVTPENNWIQRPDWNWVKRTGGQFVLYQEGYQHNDARLAEVADLSDPAKVLRLPKNLVLAPLRIEPVTFGTSNLKGRYVRLQLNGKNYLSLAEVRILGAGNVNLAQGKVASQSSSIGGDSGLPAKAVDGITDGDYAKGSVTHTGADPQSWWQVDLGASQEIRAIQVFNRTDGASERLSDFWIFVSDDAFAAGDTPATLSARPGVAKVRVSETPSPSLSVAAATPVTGVADSVLSDNGYVRLVGNSGAGKLTRFSTNRASQFSMEVEAARPVRLQYLFWPNERLTYYVDGSSVATTVEDGLTTVAVPAGRHRVEIRYTYWPLQIFLFLYSVYALLLSGILLHPWMPASWKQRLVRLSRRREPPLQERATAA